MKKYYIFICWFISILPLSNYAQVSLNMNLLDQWDQSGLSYNDVWGYADASGNEYAIIGSLSKIHFFRITANNTLLLVDDFTPGATSIWRDFKTYGNYAYACADQGAEGLLVYDLSNLPNSVTLSHQITSEFSRAHNIYIDEANGRLYVAGSNTQNNGLIVYDVTTNPPTHLASVALTGGGYVHDVYVNNNIAYCSHGFNGYYIWDMTTPTNPSFQASFTGENGYNHSSWVSPDGNTAYYAREVGVGLPMTALDISNYNNISVLSNWKFPLLAPNHVDNVPHNPFLLGNYLFTSYYEDGVQVFDVTDPNNVTVAAYYDTYPSNNSYNGYNGCWGVYPYLPSGKILASDDVGGLFLLELDFSGGGVPLSINLVSQTNVTCFGGNDGTLEVSASGGGTPYSYSINNGTPQSSGIFNNLLAGTYNVEVMDAQGNSISIPVTITEPLEVSPFILNQQNILCNGDGNGAITVSAVGGTVASGYQYSIDGVNFTFNNSFTNLVGGNYLLTVKDDFNCEGTLSFFINEPAPLITIVDNITNVDCNGNQNGEATFNTFGGTQTYTFSIDQINFQPSSTFNNLSGGNYTLITKDANDCETQTPFAIDEPSALTIAVSQQTNLNCFGDNNGEVVLDGQGGAGNLEYNMDGGSYQTSSTFSNLTAGNYNFNVKDANDCITSVSVMISSPPELILQIGQVTQIDCFGDNTGAFTVNASGGIGNFTIEMNGNIINGNTANFENLSAGNYIVNLIDGNGCTNSENVQINENPEVQLFLTSSQNVSCFGAGNGAIEVQTVGGIGNYNYFLNNTPNGNNNTFTNLQAGQYDVIVIDDLGCQDVLPVMIDEPTEIQTSITSQTNETCAGASNGSISIQALGGVGNFTYTLNGNSNSTGVFNNLSAGNYSAVILDGNNCVENISFSITAPDPINAQLSNQVNVDCFGENSGSIEIQANGGTGTLNFSLGNQTNSTGIFQNLTAGNYNIQITDQNNCSTNISTTISEPSEISASIDNQQNVNCFGENSGSIEIQANGGTGTLNFTLGNLTNATGVFQNLTAGNYNIQITDQNNCQSSISFNIAEPDELILATTQVNLADCNGQLGSIQVAAQGGTLPYSFANGNITNSSGLFENLTAGIYMITVIDANNCTEAIDVNIIEPNALNVEIIQTQNPTCFGENSGSIQLNTIGGTGTINYTLGNQTNTTGLFENLTANTYNITITDDNNCTSIIEIEISDPPLVEIQINEIANIDCYGDNSGSVNLNASGGTGALSFSLGNLTNTSGIFENLTAGNYEASVNDINGCSAIINFSIAEPTELTANLIANNAVICAGENSGAVQFEAVGGTGNYQFTLNGATNTTGLFENLAADDYEMILMDENGCSFTQNVSVSEPLPLALENINVADVLCFGESTGQINVNASGGIGDLEFTIGNETNTTGNFLNFAAGIYQLEVADQNGCTTSTEVTIDQSEEIILESVFVQNVLCSGEASGSLNLNATGGAGPLQYIYLGQSNFNGTFENLEAGVYEIIIMDTYNCTNIISIEIEEPQPLEIIFEQGQNVTCFGESSGSIDLGASGGTGNIEFSLGNQTNFSGVFENLSAGTYDVIATDNNMCTSSIQIEVTQPEEITFEIIQQQNILCHGDTNGSVNINAIGGSGSFEFSLGNEENSNGVFENLEAGTYEITVTDNNMCTSSIQIEVTQPNPIEVTVIQTADILCAFDTTAVIDVDATGGDGDFEYTLGNETNDSGIFENLPAGTYDIITTDQNGCSVTTEFLIQDAAPIISNLSVTQEISCYGVSNGIIQAAVLGSMDEFTYTLNGTVTNSTGTFENLIAGTYEVVISDINNCTSIETISLTEPTELILSLENLTPADCAGAATGSFQVTATGGTGSYTYTIDGQTNTDGNFENLIAGVYDCIVTDENNCNYLLQVTVNENNDINLETLDVVNLDCFGDTNGQVQLAAVGGMGSLIYTLGNETNITGTFENLTAGVYNITISDSINCSSFIQVEITEPAELTIDTTIITPIDCFGENTGLVEVSGSGGTGNLLYAIDGGNPNTNHIFENLSGGIHTIFIIDENDCTDSISVNISEPSAVGLIILNQTNDLGNAEGSITFEGQGGTPGYQYSLDGINFQSENIFENLSSGMYIGYMIDANGCLTEIPFEIDLETSIINPDLGILKLDVFPNPFTENIVIQINAAIAQQIQFEIVSITGQKVVQQNMPIHQGKQFIPLTVEENMPAGIYILTVKSNLQTIGYFKIIKQ